MNNGPIRKVVDSILLEHSTSIFKQKRWGSRYWQLTLECGHLVERNARYRQDVKTPISRTSPCLRAEEDVLPAPKKVHCYECQQKGIK